MGSPRAERADRGRDPGVRNDGHGTNESVRFSSGAARPLSSLRPRGSEPPRLPRPRRQVRCRRLDGLTSVGGYPGDDEKGGQLFGKVDRAKMTEDFVAAAKWLKARPESTGKLGAVGFCFGGGIVNTLAVQLGSDLSAGVPFYGA